MMRGVQPVGFFMLRLGESAENPHRGSSLQRQLRLETISQNNINKACHDKKDFDRTAADFLVVL